MDEIFDQKQRSLALDLSNSFIVQAPAGSGKTSLLVQRFLKLLGKAADLPEEILAITFTKKAADEMRNRISETLLDAATNPPPQDPHSRKMWDLSRAVIDRSVARGWNLLEYSNRLRIYTIDGLCSLLTKQMPILAGFGAQPDILEGEDCYAAYCEAAKKLLESLFDDPPYKASLEYLLLHLDNDWNKTITLLANLLVKRDQWLPHIVSYSEIDALRQDMEEGLQHIIKDAIDSCESSCPKDILRELTNILISNPHFVTNADDKLLFWQAVANICLTKTGKWRKNVTAKNGFPASEKKLKTAMKQLLEDLIPHEELKTNLQNILLLPQGKYSDNEWEVIASLLELLKVLAAQLKLVFHKTGSVDFIEIALAAHQALGDIKNPTDLTLKLDHKIRHILVDEFQDTSVIQYSLLEKLTGGWENSDGRTLFLVGDPMQSIYKFREAKVGLFLKAKNEGINFLKLKSLTLATNFRSEKPVVEWVNSSFEKIFPNIENIATGAVLFSPVVAHKSIDTTGKIEFHNLPDYSIEAGQVVRIVQNTWKENPNATIAVLVRYRSHLVEIIPALQKANLNYKAVELKPLAETTIVQDLFALTSAVLNLKDRISWLAILRAPWCGLTLADLHTITGVDNEKQLWEIIQDYENISSLTLDGKTRLKNLVNLFIAHFKQFRKISFRLFIENLWLMLGGPDCVTNSSSLEDAKIYFKLLAKHEVANTIEDIENLKKQLTDLYATSIDNDAKLQLMTIHKAKGLEFDTVIIPGLNRKPRNQDAKLLLWTERPTIGNNSECDLIFAPIKASDVKQNLTYQYLQHLDKQRNQYELQRLFYVAATRTKTDLHLLACNDKKPNSGSLLDLLWPNWPSVENQWLEETPNNDQEPITNKVLLRRLINLPKISLTNKFLVPPSFPRTRESSGVKNSGIVIHNWLAKLTRLDLDSWLQNEFENASRFWKRELMQLGTYENLNSWADKIGNALSNTINDPRGRWILDNSHRNAYSEYPISYDNGSSIKHLIIDRTFISNQICWIIDYKTTTSFENRLEYRNQLERYAQAMQNLVAYPIRLGVYFPLLKKWIEWEAKNGRHNQ